MNKRIKDFAIDAFFDESTSIPSDKMYTFSEDKMQKFAELIVKECADVADFVKEHAASYVNPGEVILKHLGFDNKDDLEGKTE